MKKYRRNGGIYCWQLLALFGAFALLVSDTAAGLASRLAGSLALAAAAVLGALAQVAGFDSLDMLHGINLLKQLSSILSRYRFEVNDYVF